MSAVQTHWLSVIVIGRDEAAHLDALFVSLAVLGPIMAETIYVDSDSSDASRAIAAAHGCQVLALPPSPFLCASAGRYVGTLAARGSWLLYLDGDMALRPEFAAWLLAMDPGAAPELAGYTGIYRFIDGATGRSIDKVIGKREGITDYFGGAVLLRRASVEAAGNWDPGVPASEEIELYVRLRALGQPVLSLDLPMVDHHTELRSTFAMLVQLLVPRSGDTKYFGIGQAVAAAWRRRSLGALARHYPLPFACFLVDAACLLGWGSGVAPYWALLVGQGLLALAAGGPKRYVLYQCLALRIPFGLLRALYRRADLERFEEACRRIFSGAASPAA